MSPTQCLGGIRGHDFGRHATVLWMSVAVCHNLPKNKASEIRNAGLPACLLCTHLHHTHASPPLLSRLPTGT
jgi:hypothetical protein